MNEINVLKDLISSFFDCQFSIVPTADGSKTIYSGCFGEHYHSTFGAASESRHVFIEAGYLATTVHPVLVLEIGFGTGLNAWLTLQQAGELCRHTHYEAIELYPIGNDTVCELINEEIFRNLHSAMNPGAVLTTYCAKGDVRRILQSVGFIVERLPGPAGKREILRARKTK